MTAARDSGAASRDALEELCTRYWPPLYSFARQRGYPVEQAQDVTQSFFARLIESRSLKAADPQRGRFRSFLLASFTHFLANDWDRERAQKRGGGMVLVPIEVETAEGIYLSHPLDTLTPERIFERQWALGVLERATATLRDECVRSGKHTLFERLKGYVEGDKSDGSYADAARTLGTTEGAVKVTVHRLRRRYREVLREEIGATVSDDADIEDEIAHLVATLSR